jgi:large subunit ribosomal protein L13
MNGSISSIKQSEIEEKWYLVDVEGRRMGTTASLIAELLLGKTNPKVKAYHNPNVKVVVINTDKISFTQKRGFSTFFKRYSGYPGGLKYISLEEQMKKDSRKVMGTVIKGMLPKNKRGNKIFSENLKIYASENHPHEAQKPEKIDLAKLKI